MYRRHAYAALCALFLGACANVVPAHIAMPEAAKSEIASTDVVVPVAQHEIYVFVPNSQVGVATGGGLLGALIDAGVNSVRSSNAEEAVKPLRNVMVGYDFDQKITSELKTALSTQAFLSVTDVKVTKDISLNLGNLITNSKSAAVLLTWLDYQLDNDGITLTVTLNANLYPNTDALKKMRTLKPDKQVLAPQNVLYRNTFVYTETLPAPAPKADRDKYIAGWSANNGAAMRAALDKAAVDLAQKLAADIPLPPAPVKAK